MVGCVVVSMWSVGYIHFEQVYSRLNVRSHDGSPSRHRFCHPSGPGRVPQQWHKDATASGYTRRLFKVGRAMLMYYPQKVIREHGPTGVIEGSQYCSMCVNRSRIRDSSLSRYCVSLFDLAPSTQLLRGSNLTPRHAVIPCFADVPTRRHDHLEMLSGSAAATEV